jgi:hypothetical protein
MLHRSVTHDLNLQHLSDHALLAATMRAAGDQRRATAQLVALLCEVDARKLYLGQGCSSLFTYCTQVLRLSEHAAYGRIEAARAARQYPLVLERLVSGELTLTAVVRSSMRRVTSRRGRLSCWSHVWRRSHRFRARFVGFRAQL